MKINKVYCLFEQSGTFKNQFKQLGVYAEDYDVSNDFGETDHQIDLFEEIRKAYSLSFSLFDEITEEDLVMAFFPCIRFENQVNLWFRGQSYSQQKWSWQKKFEHCIKLENERRDLYELVNMLFTVCMNKGIRFIMENPYSEEHYLRRYWCYPPSIIDMDRRENGDYYKKPTQYWFVNCKPEFHELEELQINNALSCIDSITKEEYVKMGVKKSI